MDKHNMKNIQLFYILLTAILNDKMAFLLQKKAKDFFFPIKIFRPAEAIRKKAHEYMVLVRAKWHLYQNIQNLIEIYANVIIRDPDKN